MQSCDLFLVSVNDFIVNCVPIELVRQEFLDLLLDDLGLTTSIGAEFVTSMSTLAFVGFTFDFFHEEHLDIVRLSINLSNAMIICRQLLLQNLFLRVLDLSHSVGVKNDVILVSFVFFRVLELVFFFGFVFEEGVDGDGVVLDFHVVDWSIGLIILPSILSENEELIHE